MKILLTGATGYVGGRLVPLLLEHGHDVDVVHYLIHGMGGADFAETDRVAATNPAAGVRAHGVDRVVYLSRPTGWGPCRRIPHGPAEATTVEPWPGWLTRSRTFCRTRESGRLRHQPELGH